jgi:hypothetical protein
MKIALTFLLSIAVTIGISQTTAAHYATSQPEQSVLYFPYKNVIELSLPAGLDSIYFKHSKCIDVQLLDSIHASIIVKSVQYEVELAVYGMKENRTLLISNTSFRIFEIPAPFLYLGNVLLNGENKNLDDSIFLNEVFFLKYTYDIPLSSMFKLRYCKIRIGEQTYSTGMFLSKEILQALKKTKKGTQIIFEKVGYSDGTGLTKYIYPNFIHYKVSEAGELR